MYGHPKVSVEYLHSIAKRLHFSRAFTSDLALLVRYHDTRPAPTKKSTRRLYAKLENKEYLFHAMRDLPLSGKDLIEAGIPEGPAIGEALEAAFQEVVEERLPLDHDALLAFALEYCRSL